MENQKISFRATRPDPRVFIFMSLTVCLLSFFLHNRELLLGLSILLAIVMAVLELRKYAAVFAIVSILGYLLEHALMQLPTNGVVTAISLLLAIAHRFLPLIMVGVIVLSRMRVNEMIVALERMRIPNLIIIPLAMAYRYVPTVRRELVYIRENMVMRGLHATIFGMLRHPMEAMEHLLVPLLIRSSKVSEELSAAALSKGVDANGKRTSATDVRFRIMDAGYALLCVLTAILLLWLQDYDFTGRLSNIIGKE
ncbi:energy-coupling factor transporter transmembrane protein EcfT [Paenibacillus sp. MER 180]|uniref:energy-coupling factor transporter transmembrane component T family protein n=1 Tax=Paenibacillus sp. MER 180 TaxID=2939570 RepID=UPI00203B46C7|nr:energy-coupling factor transporter transmembrane component T [Paenibacillus sp. MER 180]MCM3293289.1 energy-coupling factor transporter transmembrane protein EcfT [Paenibacillus sp. MER 180]